MSDSFQALYKQTQTTEVESTPIQESKLASRFRVAPLHKYALFHIDNTTVFGYIWTALPQKYFVKVG